MNTENMPINIPPVFDNEFNYVKNAIESRKLSGDGHLNCAVFLNGTKIANLVHYLRKGITDEPSKKNEQDLFT